MAAVAMDALVIVYFCSKPWFAGFRGKFYIRYIWKYIDSPSAASFFAKGASYADTDVYYWPGIEKPFLKNFEHAYNPLYLII